MHKRKCKLYGEKYMYSVYRKMYMIELQIKACDRLIQIKDYAYGIIKRKTNIRGQL